MIDYTNHLFDIIVITRIATWTDFCKFKPHRTKPVSTLTGTQHIHRSNVRNKARYWFWQCLRCENQGIIRADNIKRWITTDHTCNCQHKCYVAPKTKHCKRCYHTWPTDRLHWYISGRGYLSTHCKRCTSAIRKSQYDYKNYCLRYEQVAGGYPV